MAGPMSEIMAQQRTALMMTPEESACGRKKTYINRAQAAKHARQAGKRHRKQLHAYRCPNCSQYHLTSMARGDFRSANERREVSIRKKEARKTKDTAKRCAQETPEGLHIAAPAYGREDGSNASRRGEAAIYRRGDGRPQAGV